MIIKGKNEDIESWSIRYSKLEVSLGEYRGYEGRLREYENKISLLS
jgi:hypothetical protein